MLGSLSILFFVAFAIQRGRSTFLAVEARAAEAAAIAGATGLATIEVMALHELANGGLTAAELERRARRFAGLRRRFGHDGLAILALTGHEAEAQRLHRQESDALSLDARIRALPEGIVAVRYAAMRERFAERRR